MNKNSNYELEMNMIITEMYSKDNPKKQKIYEIILGVLIFLSVILSAIIGALVEKNAIIYIILCMLICWGLIGVLAFARKQIMNKKIYKIINAHNNFNIVEFNKNIIEDLRKGNALVFCGKPNSKFLDFLYNILNNCNAINNKNIDIYTLTIKDIRDKYNYDYSKMIGNEIPNEYEIFCIKISDLKLDDNNLRDFSLLKNILGIQYFEDFTKFVCKKNESI